MASAVLAGWRLRQAVEGGELAGLPDGLQAELEAALASQGALVPFSLLRRLHTALREAGRPRRPWHDRLRQAATGPAAVNRPVPHPQGPRCIYMSSWKAARSTCLRCRYRRG